MDRIDADINEHRALQLGAMYAQAEALLDEKRHAAAINDLLEERAALTEGPPPC